MTYTLGLKNRWTVVCEHPEQTQAVDGGSVLLHPAAVHGAVSARGRCSGVVCCDWTGCSFAPSCVMQVLAAAQLWLGTLVELVHHNSCCWLEVAVGLLVVCGVSLTGTDGRCCREDRMDSMLLGMPVCRTSAHTHVTFLHCGRHSAVLTNPGESDSACGNYAAPERATPGWSACIVSVEQFGIVLWTCCSFESE